MARNVYAARIRAARAYAGLKQQELADALGHDSKTQIRREADDGDPPRRAELIAIAVVCGVPLSFLDHGFQDASSEPERLAEAKSLADQARGLAELREREVQEESEPSPAEPPPGATEQSEPDPPRRANGKAGRRNTPQ